MVVSTQKMKHLYIASFLIILFPISISGQITGKVTDKSTGIPIPYVNVFLKNKPIGATSNQDGSFEIKSVSQADNLIVSAIGYETLEVRITSNYISIQLTPKVYELPPVIIKPHKSKSQIITGDFKRNKINNYFACIGYPWIVTKFIDYKQEFYTTPFIKQLKILTSCVSRDSVIFNLRLLTLDQDSVPNIDLLGKNLIIKAKRGINQFTTIDLNQYSLTFPKTGLIIAVEWLILDQNKTISRFGVKYYPDFGSITRDGDRKTWNYNGGKWTKVSLLPPAQKHKYAELAAEVTLTN